MIGAARECFKGVWARLVSGGHLLVLAARHCMAYAMPGEYSLMFFRPIALLINDVGAAVFSPRCFIAAFCFRLFFAE
jgi:hypothetical protein